MKKLIALAVAALIGTTASMAQVYKGDAAVGANLVYGFGIKNIGLGAKFQYTFIDHLRGETAFNYFFKHDYRSQFDASINAHYLVTLREDRLFVYPLAGLTFSTLTFDENGAVKKWGGGAEDRDKDYNRVGANLGAGVQFQFNQHWGFTFEYRYSIMKDIDQSVIGFGANYKF